MLAKILIPLDGSQSAEEALPIAVQLAEAYASKLILFHGIESNAPAKIHGERHLQSRAEAEVYLDTCKAFLLQYAASDRFEIAVHIHESAIDDIGRGIIDHISELEPDLIVMCSHGKKGIRKTMLGSLPLQILKMGKIPVLLVQPSALELKLEFSRPIRTLLLPLDSASRHDNALITASNLAQHLTAELTLLTVVPTVSTQKSIHSHSSLHMPLSTRMSLEMESAEIARHLSEHRALIHNEFQNPISVHTLVARGDIVRQIQATAASLQACLIVVGTHRKIGMEAFWDDSIAFRLALATTLPLLLIPV